MTFQEDVGEVLIEQDRVLRLYGPPIDRFVELASRYTDRPRLRAVLKTRTLRHKNPGRSLSKTQLTRGQLSSRKGLPLPLLKGSVARLFDQGFYFIPFALRFARSFLRLTPPAILSVTNRQRSRPIGHRDQGSPASEA